jgi:hypothetical protein
MAKVVRELITVIKTGWWNIVNSSGVEGVTEEIGFSDLAVVGNTEQIKSDRKYSSILPGFSFKDISIQ